VRLFASRSRNRRHRFAGGSAILLFGRPDASGAARRRRLDDSFATNWQSKSPLQARDIEESSSPAACSVDSPQPVTRGSPVMAGCCPPQLGQTARLWRLDTRQPFATIARRERDTRAAQACRESWQRSRAAYNCRLQFASAQRQTCFRLEEVSRKIRPRGRCPCEGPPKRCPAERQSARS